MKRWSVHSCDLDSECRDLGAPHRVSVSAPRFYLAVALTPGSKFTGRIDMEAFLKDGTVRQVEPDRWIHFRRCEPVE